MKISKLFFLAAFISFTIIAKAQWTSQASGVSTTHFVGDISIASSNVVWASTFDTTNINNGSYTRTIDGGTTWVPSVVTNSTYWMISSLTAVDQNNAWVTMLDGNNGGGGIFHTNNGGTSWAKQTTTQFTGPDGWPKVIHFWNVNDGIAIGDPNPTGFEIYTTTNGGITWTAVPAANIPPNISGEVGAWRISSIIGNTIWFGTYSGRVYKSIDKGLNWTVSQTTLNEVYQIAFKDANNGLISDGSTLLRTSDGGTTWTNVNYTGTIFDFGLSYIPGTSGSYFMTGENGSSYSLDNGNTWITADNLPHTSVKFLNATTGWSGGINASPTSGGMFKWNGPVAIKENNSADAAVKIFPAPMKETSFVTLPDETRNATFTLHDVYGKTVKEINGISTTQFAIHRENLPAGIYFYKVTDAGKGISKIVGTGKIIIE